nr:low affinity iron permease family protein [Rhizobium sp. ARZ01]
MRGRARSINSKVAQGHSVHEHLFTKFANKVADWSGHPATFAGAVCLVSVWGITGPFFGFSETWQLIINTGTTIITFLMVFILQNSQIRDNRAIQAKLDELILSSHAQNNFVGIENLEEEELRELSQKLAEQAKRLAGAADGSS